VSRAFDLGPALRADDAAVVVTTTEAATGVVERLTERTDADRNRLRGVDCMSAATDGGPTVTGVSSPADLTGIGMHVDRHLSDVDDRGLRPRVGLLSVSTLLLYADVRPVFRFLHVLTNRVSATDGLGVFLLDAGTHDDRVAGAITTLFDARASP